MQGYAHVKRHVAWTRIITHSMDRVTCARVQRLVELHCITSVVAARLLAGGCRKAKKMMSKGSSELASTSSSPSPSPSSSPDVAVIKESTLALAVLGVGLVTFHAVESRDTSAARCRPGGVRQVLRRGGRCAGGRLGFGAARYRTRFRCSF